MYFSTELSCTTLLLQCKMCLEVNTLMHMFWVFFCNWPSSPSIVHDLLTCCVEPRRAPEPFLVQPPQKVCSPQKPSPGKRLKAGINTGANGVTALLGERDRKETGGPKHTRAWTWGIRSLPQLLSGASDLCFYTCDEANKKKIHVEAHLIRVGLK